MLSIKDVVKRTTISRSTWLRLVNAGTAPKPVRISTRRVAWRESDVEQYLQSCK